MVSTVLLHIDRTDGGGVAWWAESPDIPGFSSAADSMSELCARVQLALDDLAEAGELDSGQVVFVLGEAPAATGNPTKVSRTDSQPDGKVTRPHARVLVG